MVPMSVLTPAAMLAWKIAATEAGAGGHPLIEPLHLAIGVLSLEKVRAAFASAAGLSEDDLGSVRIERATLAEMLSGLQVRAAAMRRALREASGQGPGAPAGPISRNPAARDAFVRAKALAARSPVTTLHLLAAVAAEPDERLMAGLTACGVDAARLAARAGAFAGVTPPSGASTGADAAVITASGLPEETEADEPVALASAAESEPAWATASASLETVRSEAQAAPTAVAADEPSRLVHDLFERLAKSTREGHAVRLEFEAEAELFVARAGSSTDEIRERAERLVEAPLRMLIGRGKLERHGAWRLVYDEGGVYWLPDD
jgi:hypothetical protein